MLGQLQLRFFPLPVFPPQLLVPLLVHFQHFYIERLVLGLLVFEDVISFFLLLLELILELLLLDLVERFGLLVLLEELMVLFLLLLGLLLLLPLQLLLFSEFSRQSFVLLLLQSLLTLLLQLFGLEFNRPLYIPVFLKLLLLLLSLPLLFLHELFGQFGLNAVRIELIFIKHLIGPSLCLLSEVKLD